MNKGNGKEQNIPQKTQDGDKGKHYLI